MDKKQRIPGEKIASIEEYLPGDNTFEDEDSIRATTIGEINLDSSEKLASVNTKINSDWAQRDAEIIKKLNLLKTNFPILVSISNKSFIGKLLGKENPNDRNTGTAIAEMLSIINGASIIRTHNPEITSDVIKLTKSLIKKSKKGL